MLRCLASFQDPEFQHHASLGVYLHLLRRLKKVSSKYTKIRPKSPLAAPKSRILVAMVWRSWWWLPPRGSIVAFGSPHDSARVAACQIVGVPSQCSVMLKCSVLWENHRRAIITAPHHIDAKVSGVLPRSWVPASCQLGSLPPPPPPVKKG